MCGCDDIQRPAKRLACVPVPSSRSKELADLDTSGFSTQGGWDSGLSPLVLVLSRRSSQKNSARTSTSTAERKMREPVYERLAEPMPSLPRLQVAKQCPAS